MKKMISYSIAVLIVLMATQSCTKHVEPILTQGQVPNQQTDKAAAVSGVQTARGIHAGSPVVGW
jgi:hypothetical protein